MTATKSANRPSTPGAPQPQRPIEILLVEDSPADVALTLEVLEEGKLANRVHTAADGVEAMSYLRGDTDGDQPRPDLVLLDLNLPRKDGREVLAEIRADPALAALPVIVLTTSAAEEDVRQAYAHHVNAYIRKPIRLDDFVEVVRSFERFWLAVVEFPAQ